MLRNYAPRKPQHNDQTARLIEAMDIRLKVVIYYSFEYKFKNSRGIKTIHYTNYFTRNDIRGNAFEGHPRERSVFLTTPHTWCERHDLKAVTASSLRDTVAAEDVGKWQWKEEIWVVVDCLKV